MNYLYLAFIALAFIVAGCTQNTEVYVYDENGIERRVARVEQEDDGVASYEIKGEYKITVDTRYVDKPVMHDVLKVKGEIEKK